ncbi:unnamed protein product [Vitrella brassicaformis CCMP3155]|uniref:Trimethylguanosine synthase n=2 Tax=Vitrella brassicaformis TaxID=1169539 RepID=A0A0G4FP57_VITBC|nr:unnamed protein product [Vitrella brassicaformis CCMP3155]|eukprot:CEM16023.1 unnamed protein product [Vitrella brassicaformis CCMP3155]
MDYVRGLWGYLMRGIGRPNDTQTNTKMAEDEEPPMSIMDMLVAELVPKSPPPAAFLKADLMLADGSVIKHNGHEKYEDEGELFEGQWVDDRIHGHGTALFASGNRYEGQWEHGRINGEGKLTYQKGAECEGDWVDGTMHGRGTYRYFEGDVYQGQWRNDKGHGEGAETPVSAKDNVVEYESDGVNGKMHGKSTCMFPDGNEVPVTATPKAESQQGREAEAMVTYIQRIEAAKRELQEGMAREATVLQKAGDQTAAPATNSAMTTTWPDPATTSAMWLATRQELEAIEAAHRVAVQGSVFVKVIIIEGPAGKGKEARQRWLATRPIKLNDEMTYSISPEAIALHQAASCSQLYPKGTVVDLFAGAGGDTIAMLREGLSVYSMDKEAEHVEILEHNTKQYGVEPVIALPEDYESVAVIDPPWGGRRYLTQKTYDLAHMADGSLSMFDVVRVAATVTDSFVTKIPKNTTILSCAELGLWVEQLQVRAQGSSRPPTTFAPPIVEVYVTREKGRRLADSDVFKPKYAAVYLGDIAKRKLKELKRASQGPPPKIPVTTSTTLEEHVMGPMCQQSSLLHQVEVSVVPHKKCWHGL